MAERTRGMGRGLSAILSSSAPIEGDAHDSELRAIPVDLISPNPRQPRRGFEQALRHRLDVGAGALHLRHRP